MTSGAIKGYGEVTRLFCQNLRLIRTSSVSAAISWVGGGAEVVGGVRKSPICLRVRAEANSALVRGDIDTYLALIEHANDYTLMAPFEGSPTRGFDASPAHRAAMARFFKSGTLHQEVVAAYDSADLVVLVTIERIRAVVDELPEQDWSLRSTQVFRHEGSKWKFVHRHADPLVSGITLN
jgi:ketosteroid isomerase-like protein